MLTIYAPEGVEVRARPDAVAAGTLETARLGRLGREIGNQLGTLDRGSSTARATLLGSLIEFEIQARSADRATSRVDPETASTTAREGIRSIRATLADLLLSTGLGDFATSARVRSGLGGDDPMPTQGDTPVRSSRFRIRHLGKPHWFRGEQEVAGRPIVASWVMTKPSNLATGSLLAPATKGLGTIATFVGLVIILGRRPKRLAAGATALTATVAMLAGGGVLVLPLVLLMIAAGRWSRRGIDPRVSPV